MHPHTYPAHGNAQFFSVTRISVGRRYLYVGHGYLLMETVSPDQRFTRWSLVPPYAPDRRVGQAKDSDWSRTSELSFTSNGRNLQKPSAGPPESAHPWRGTVHPHTYPAHGMRSFLVSPAFRWAGATCTLGIATY